MGGRREEEDVEVRSLGLARQLTHSSALWWAVIRERQVGSSCGTRAASSSSRRL